MQTYVPAQTAWESRKLSGPHKNSHKHTQNSLLIVVCQKNQHALFARSSTSAKAAIQWSLLIVLAIQLLITHEENKESWHNNLSTPRCVESVLRQSHNCTIL